MDHLGVKAVWPLVAILASIGAGGMVLLRKHYEDKPDMEEAI